MNHDHVVASEHAKAAVRLYTPKTLKMYDAVVYGFNTRLLWRCPEEELVANYDRNISANHLDVGVGSGFLLDRARFPVPNPRIVLMDLNPHSLAATAARIQRYRPKTVLANVLEPIPFEGEHFDSIGTNYMIHCVPGSIPQKAVLFDHLDGLLNPGGVLFGSTVLGTGVDPNVLARVAMRFLNRRAIFNNLNDSEVDLRKALEDRFVDVSLHVVGIVAIFSARKPKMAA